jgi:hypothetical protein
MDCRDFLKTYLALLPSVGGSYSNETWHTYAAHDALHLVSFDRWPFSFRLVAREDNIKFTRKKENSTLGHTKSLSSLFFEMGGWNSYLIYPRLSCSRWLSPIFDLGLYFSARIFEILTFFVIHHSCQVNISSVWRPKSPQRHITRGIRHTCLCGIECSFQWYQSHSCTTENKKSSIRGMWRTIDKWRLKRNQACGGCWGGSLITYKGNFACWVGSMSDTLCPSFRSLRPLAVEKLKFWSCNFQPQSSFFVFHSRANQPA